MLHVDYWKQLGRSASERSRTRTSSSRSSSWRRTPRRSSSAPRNWRVYEALPFVPLDELVELSSSAAVTTLQTLSTKDASALPLSQSQSQSTSGSPLDPTPPFAPTPPRPTTTPGPPESESAWLRREAPLVDAAAPTTGISHLGPLDDDDSDLTDLSSEAGDEPDSDWMDLDEPASDSGCERRRRRASTQLPSTLLCLRSKKPWKVPAGLQAPSSPSSARTRT